MQVSMHGLGKSTMHFLTLIRWPWTIPQADAKVLSCVLAGFFAFRIRQLLLLRLGHGWAANAEDKQDAQGGGGHL
jgi:hypothetical protein